MSQQPGPARSTAGVPLNFTSSTQRIWSLTRRRTRWLIIPMALLAVLLIAVVSVLLLCGFIVWGLVVLPYRLLRLNRSVKGRAGAAQEHPHPSSYRIRHTGTSRVTQHPSTTHWEVIDAPDQ